MKTALILVLAGVAFLVLKLKFVSPEPSYRVSQVNNPLLSTSVAFCGVPSGNFYRPDSLAPLSLMEGLGDWEHKITTKSELAQKYFNQGLNLLYAFNHEKAIRSFQAALKLDPDCAMAYWGIAYAYGPNINLPMSELSEKMASEAIEKAVQLKEKVSGKEASYIDALSLRYSADTVNQNYEEAMRALSYRYKEDADAQTLYADAVMNTFPWQYWEKDGKFKPRALIALAVLQRTLNMYPRHPGANHLMIHLVEGSDSPEKGLKSAAALTGLMPRAGHIVHMPSHIYIRTGSFQKAAQTNVQAIKVDEDEYGMVLPAAIYAMYYGHNIHFLFFTTNMLGQSVRSMETAGQLLAKVPKEQLAENAFFQELAITPFYAMIRFGKWDEMLNETKPGDQMPYMQSIWHLGRGLAFLRKDNLKAAAFESAQLDSLSNLDVLKSAYASLDPVSKPAGIANVLLKGELEIARGNRNQGLSLLRKAVVLEDSLIYGEPPTWPIPVRQYLGAALLKSKNYPEAEKIYREDLKRHPENGWSLFGLKEALQSQWKITEAKKVNERFKKVWKDADIELMASRF